MDARVAAGRVQALADAGRADLGARRLPEDRFQDIHYYSAPKGITGPKSIDDVDPELLRVYEKLGIPLREQEILAGVQQSKIAVDAVFDSVSVVTTFKEELKKAGVIFMSISERCASIRNWCRNISAPWFR
jgi:Fe-S cluster assembly scaffold protein SufB